MLLKSKRIFSCSNCVYFTGFQRQNILWCFKYWFDKKTLKKLALMKQLRYNHDSFCCRGVGKKGTLQQLSQKESLYDFHESNINMSLQIFIYTEQEKFLRKFSGIFQKANIFLSAIGMPHSQLWDILEGTASLAQC